MTVSVMMTHSSKLNVFKYWSGCVLTSGRKNISCGWMRWASGPPALPRETAAGVHWTGRWEVSTACLDALEKREIRQSCQKSNHSSLVVWSITYSFTLTGLYRAPAPTVIRVKNGLSGVDCEMKYKAGQLHKNFACLLKLDVSPWSHNTTFF